MGLWRHGGRRRRRSCGCRGRLSCSPSHSRLPAAIQTAFPASPVRRVNRQRPIIVVVRVDAGSGFRPCLRTRAIAIVDSEADRTVPPRRGERAVTDGPTAYGTVASPAGYSWRPAQAAVGRRGPSCPMIINVAILALVRVVVVLIAVIDEHAPEGTLGSFRRAMRACCRRRGNTGRRPAAVFPARRIWRSRRRGCR